MYLAYGYSFGRHSSNYSVINAVSTKTSVYSQRTNEIIGVFEKGELTESFNERVRLEIELHEEIDGPTTLHMDRFGQLINESGQQAWLFTSKTYPIIKLGQAMLCACMIWTERMEETPDMYRDILECLNSKARLHKDYEKIAYVCEKLGIENPTIEWDGRCCS